MDSLLGALLGDAIGAHLEFNHHIVAEDVERALTLPGGGAVNVGPGQFTDDGELTLSLAHSISDKPYYHPSYAAKMYRKWYLSHPFDCGRTCARAFHVLEGHSELPAMLTNAARYNMLSEANGALMRVSPIAIFFRKEPVDVLAQYAKLDACLSHPSQVCQDCNAVYVIALASLLTNKNPLRALEDASNYVETSVRSEVREWFFEDRKTYTKHPEQAKKHVGHVKHAFCMAINVLDDPPESYIAGIKRILLAGGDTDTNACITGAMLGAFLPLPQDLVRKLLSYKYKESDLVGFARPPEYTAKGVQAIKKKLELH